jgi:uncharacterized membrane protein (DUF2068 family)
MANFFLTEAPSGSGYPPAPDPGCQIIDAFPPGPLAGRFYILLPGCILIDMDEHTQGRSSPPAWNRVGIRTIAIFEAFKVVLLLTTGFGLLALVHHDLEAVAVSIVRHLHANPASKYPEFFIKASRQVTDTNLRMLALLALIDSILRAIEAVGLWLDRTWGKWLGVATGVIYLPFEVYELSHGATFFKLAALGVNVVIVLYLVYAVRRPHVSLEQNR